jgi:hypothetical protein
MRRRHRRHYQSWWLKNVGLDYRTLVIIGVATSLFVLWTLWFLNNIIGHAIGV